MEAHAELEAQLLHFRKMESIGTLTGGIAHHFNNILTIIMGNTELALDEVLSSHPAHSSLEEIYNASHRAKEIINQLSNFTDKAMMNRKSINLVSLIQNTVELLRATISSSIEIHYHFHCPRERDFCRSHTNTADSD